MSFIFPSFLFALFTVLIPVIIHLFNLRRPKKVYFSNIDLLREVEQQTSKKLKIKSWLILLSRILFIAFLVLVFAQPVLRSDHAQKSSNTPVYSIYLDNSLSMELPYDAELSLYQGALKELDKLISLLPRNAKIQIVNNGFGAGSMVFLGKDQARERLTEMNQSRQFRSKQEVYQRQLKSLETEPEQDKTIIWLSDFQKTFYNSNEPLRIDTNIRHYFVPLNGRSISNIYVDSVELASPFIRQGEIQKLNIWLKNSGNQDQSGIALKLNAGDQQISNQNLDMVAGSSEKVELNFVLKETGKHRLTLTINDNMVRFDNEYAFVLNVGEKIFIKEITDRKDSPIGRIYGNESVFDFVSYSSDNIDFSGLSGANLIILNELKTFSNALKSGINAFLAEGGSLVIIPDPSNIRIFDELAMTVEERKDTTRARVVVPSMDNPFFRGVMAKYVGKADMPYAKSILNVVNTKTSIMKLNNGMDFLSGINNGKGTIYAFSSPFNETYSNIYKHSWVVPLCYRMAMLTSRSNQNIQYRFEDSDVKVRYVAGNNESVLTVKNGDQVLIPGQRRISAYTLLDMPQNEMEKGFYDVFDKDSIVDLLAFNPSKRESEMEFVSAGELQLENEKIKILAQEGEINFSDTFSEQNIGVALWKYCLLLSLLFLATEIVLIRVLN